jgi:tRNA-Thr(GGU) m(6)t(6)A37 methyltransferase TsaA
MTSGVLSLEPIGVAHTPFNDRVSAPRQPRIAEGVEGTIELFAGHGYEHALADLEGWDRIWVVFWFHLNEGWRPKVLPPRSTGKRRGVFSTRSPHRPNPIGISAVRLMGVEGLVLRVKDVDLVDGTPVLDIKPYVPYADAFPEASTGWLESQALEPDPWTVTWSPHAREQAAWLAAAHGIDLVSPIERTLALGPQPHPYRRIKVVPGGHVLAVKAWRALFHVAGREVTVDAIASGYKESQLATLGDEGAAHRELIARSPAPPART